MAIQGLSSLQKKFQALPGAVQAEIRAAMEQAAGEVVDMAKRLVPVDSGDLQKSIGWTWGAPPRGAITIGQVLSGRRKGNANTTVQSNMTITIYAGNSVAFYARWIEFGTAPHLNKGKFPGTKHPGTAARPFFFPAYRAQKKKVKRLVRGAARKAAKKVAANG